MVRYVILCNSTLVTNLTWWEEVLVTIRNVYYRECEMEGKWTAVQGECESCVGVAMAGSGHVVGKTLGLLAFLRLIMISMIWQLSAPILSSVFGHCVT